MSPEVIEATGSSGGEPSWVPASRRYLRDVIDAWNGGGEVSHARDVAELAVGLQLWNNPWQRPAEFVPGLVAQPLHDTAIVPLARPLDEDGAGICAEAALLAAQWRAHHESLAGQASSTSHSLSLAHAGRWNSHPVTNIRSAFGTSRPHGDVTVLTVPGAVRLPPSCGETNGLLTMIVPIQVPADAQLRLAGDAVALTVGHCLLADLSYEHEIVGSQHDEPLVLLLVEVPHPALSPSQIEARFGPSARLRQFLQRTGLDQVDLVDDEVVLRPGPDLAQLAGRYLVAAGIRELTRPDDEPSSAGWSVTTVEAARKAYSGLIDSLHSAGQTALARRFTELAVTQQVWDHPMQRDRDHVPGLTATPFHDPSSFWFVSRIEARAAQIRYEILRVLDAPDDPVQRTLEDGWLLDGGSWQQAYLFRDGEWHHDVTAHFPTTTAILAEIAELTTFSPGAILISRLVPGTHITPHCGSTNAVLRIHLGITVPQGTSLRVADELTSWEEGRCLIFDDSFEHEVRHDGTGDRVVLIMDMAHPELDPSSRPRLLAQRPTPRSRALSFMRERGLIRLRAESRGRDHDVTCVPGAALSDELAGHLAELGLRSARVDDEDPAPRIVEASI